MSNEEQQGIPAVGFLVMAFTDENVADEALDAMKDAKKQGQFYFEDAAVIRQDPKGKVHYHETGDMSTGRGAGWGALVGGVVGVLGGPAGVVAGAGVGAAIGGALASGDKGFKSESLNTVGLALKPGTSAVAAITSRDFLKAVQQNVPIEEIRAVVANLATNLSNRLTEGKDVAIGLLLTADGLAIREIAADETSAEVVGAVITSDAIAVGSVVITDEGAVYEVAVATEEGVVDEVGVITDEGDDVEDMVAMSDDAEASDEEATDKNDATTEDEAKS